MTARCLFAMVCVLALATTPADARKHRDPCKPGHATTEFDNGRFRVYSVPTEDGDAEYLCVWKTRKRFKLAEGSGGGANGDGLNGFSSAGRFFLYETTPFGTSLDRGPIQLLDTRSGRHTYPAYNGWPLAETLSPAGTIAYTTDPSQGPAPRGVYLLPLRAAQPEQLDVGDDIDTASLALAGHTLYWTKAGQPRSAQIP